MENNTPNVAQWFVLLVSAGMVLGFCFEVGSSFADHQDPRMLGIGMVRQVDERGF